MTEEKKEELRQLLNAAIASLEIRPRWGNHPSLPVFVYGKLLQEYWKSYLPNLASQVEGYEFHFVNETTKLKLLDFIKEEFAAFIHEDKIQSASFFVKGGIYEGFPLGSLLDQLLKIAIGSGIEIAILDFDRCTQSTPGSFQCIALLEGINVEEEIQVFESTRLVPISNSTGIEYSCYLDDFIIRASRRSKDDFFGKTLLITDCSISPRLHKPVQATNQEYSISKYRIFRIEVNSKIFPKTNMEEFYTYMEEFDTEFCRALSLACNSSVQIAIRWRSLAENQLFNLSSGSSGGQFNHVVLANSILGSSIKTGETQINEAKRLYDRLTNLNTETLEKLRIPIDRWIKSKTSVNPVDKMIDLGIAFEALYLSDISEPTELSFRLRLHAAWHLKKKKEDRKALMKEFVEIYKWRSSAVHKGKLPEKKLGKKKKRPFTQEEITKFITKAQNLCRDSIMKILEDGEFPDWNSLILGEEAS